MVVVKGPGPSCERVGRGRIVGRAGLNRFRFDGTVRNVPLEPGTYRLDTTIKAGGKRLGSAFVTIVDPRSPSKRYARPKCSPAKLSAVARPPQGPVLGHRDPVLLTAISAPVQRKSPELAKPKAGRTPSDDIEQTQVLGQLTPPETGGAPIDVAADGSRTSLELVLLLSGIGLLIVLGSLIYGSLRRRRSLA